MVQLNEGQDAFRFSRILAQQSTVWARPDCPAPSENFLSGGERGRKVGARERHVPVVARFHRTSAGQSYFPPRAEGRHNTPAPASIVLPATIASLNGPFALWNLKGSGRPGLAGPWVVQ